MLWFFIQLLQHHIKVHIVLLYQNISKYLTSLDEFINCSLIVSICSEFQYFHKRIFIVLQLLMFPKLHWIPNIIERIDNVLLLIICVICMNIHTKKCIKNKFCIYFVYIFMHINFISYQKINFDSKFLLNGTNNDSIQQLYYL